MTTTERGQGLYLKKSTYAGLFLVTLGTLMYEILLPRIFSVTMFYHFAFMAVSLAMFGMTVGAVIVYLYKDRYTEASASRDMAMNAFLFAVTSVSSLFIYLKLPILGSTELEALPLITLSFVVIAVPFIFSGITVAIALTRFPAFVGRLYAVDLLGAATGCVLIVVTLEHTDAPTAAVVIAALIAVSAFCFALVLPNRRYQLGFGLGALVIAGLALGHHLLVQNGRALMRVEHGPFAEIPRLYQRWNSFSYVEVLPGFVPARGQTLGWGMSSTLPPELEVRQLPMDIDIKAGTSITAFDGDTRPLEFLRYDLTNAAHQIRRQADICVIGVGGGRDILSALDFDQRSVLGIELNENVLGALTGPFGDFSGHLDRHAKVQLVVDEARSFMARTDKRCDVIQISLIDTFAATAAGAFVLAENSLYTVEAWELFLRRLKPAGVLSVSRYYYHQRPAEAYRMLSLGVAALANIGVSEYRQHLVLIKNQTSFMAGAAGIGTLLVSNAPFAPEDLARLAAYAHSMNFEVVLSPSVATEPVLERVASGRDLPAFYDDYEIDISPPTDDRPFFFQMLRLRDVLSSKLFDAGDVNWKNLKAILILAALLAIVVVLTVGCIVVPLLRTRDRSPLKNGTPLSGFFRRDRARFHLHRDGTDAAADGVSRAPDVRPVRRAVHAALGERPRQPDRAAAARAIFDSSPGPIVWRARDRGLSVDLASPPLMTHFETAVTSGRIAIAVGLLLPLGLLMGMPFPMGMRRAAELAPSRAVALGINGATSVCASVLAVIIALSLGIRASYWAGIGFYAVAGAVYVLSVRAQGASETRSSPVSDVADS